LFHLQTSTLIRKLMILKKRVQYTSLNFNFKDFSILSYSFTIFELHIKNYYEWECIYLLFPSWAREIASRHKIYPLEKPFFLIFSGSDNSCISTPLQYPEKTRQSKHTYTQHKAGDEQLYQVKKLKQLIVNVSYFEAFIEVY